MKPLQVAVNAMTLPPNLAGIGFYTLNLLRALSDFPEIGAFTLFTNRAAADAFPPLPSKVRLEGVPLGGIASKVAYSQVGLPRCLVGFDLLHSVGNVACLGARLPQVATVHDLCNRVIPRRFTWPKRIYLDWGIGLTVSRARSIICVSESTRRDLVRYHPGAEGKACVVHSACKYTVDPEERGERAGFLFVGTLEPGKNLDVALRALALLRGRGQAATLKVVGAKGWKQSHIPALVRGLGLEGAVEFSGYLDDAGLKAAYKAAIGLIFPSAYEGFGFPILEAQSQGCPVLSADNSSLREIGGEASRYFQTGDPEGLAALMASCLAGGQEWESARDEGFRNCGRFSWERSAEGTWAAYRSALGRRP